MLPEEDNLIQKNSFSKTERICSKKIIKNLIVQNQTLFVYPFKCYFFIENSNIQVNTNQIAVTISKRIFKRAVDRNLIKRRSKEAYRIHRRMLNYTDQEALKVQYQVLFVYIAKEILTFQQIEKSMMQILKLLNQKTVPTQDRI